MADFAVRDGGGTSTTIPHPRSPMLDHSGTVTSGGTSQQVMPANASRGYLLIQNLSTDILWINFGVAAVQNQPSIKLFPGDSYERDGRFIPNDSVTLIGPTTGAAYTAKDA